MFFKKLRSKSSSSSSSKSHTEKPSISRITSRTTSSPSHNTSSPSHNNNNEKMTPRVTISSPTSAEFSEKRRAGDGVEEEDEEEQAAREFQEFLAKAKRDAERKERETARSIMRARETNLSPWAGRM